MSTLETTIIKHPSSVENNLTLNADGSVDFYSPTSGGAAPGAVMYYAMKTPPVGWLVCDGSSHPIASYPFLHAAIGDTFGGDATNFNVPDLRGEFIRGWDDGRGVDAGRAFGSGQGDMFGSHGHDVNDPGHAHHKASQSGSNGANNDPDYIACGIFANAYGELFTRGSDTGISIAVNGGNETRPKNVALLPCIKT